MKIEIVNTELPRVDADAICEKVNRDLEWNEWLIAIEDGMPMFFSSANGTYWEISLDGYDMVWKLNYGYQCVGVVKIEDDVDILYNR